MNKKQKKMLWRIIVSAVLMVALHFVPVTGLVRFALYMVTYFIVGYDILWKAVLGIWNRQVFDENFLMAVATVGAIVIGLTDSGDYTEAIAVMLFYQIGELFQSYAVGRSRKNISELMDIRPDYANIEVDGQLEQVDPDEVEVGSIIIVQPGEKVPIDGIVVEGRSTLNTAALTGESLPVEKDLADIDGDVPLGDRKNMVFSGCFVTYGRARFLVTSTGMHTEMGRIAALLKSTEEKKTPLQVSLDQFSSKLAFGVFNLRFPNHRTNNDWLSRVEENVDRYIADPLCNFTFTVAGFKDLLNALMCANSRSIIENTPTDLPILFLSGSMDPVGEYGAGVRAACMKYLEHGCSVNIRVYPEARHELLFELNADEVMNDILAFINKRL